MRNPVRDESAAFRFVLFALAAFGLIALASWIDTWLGVAVSIVLLALAAHMLRGGRTERERKHVVRLDDGVHRVLVIANETVEGAELLDAVRERVGGAGAALIVVPALNSRLRLWVSDEDGARAAAAARLDASLARLRAVGLDATGRVGDSDPVQAVEDALRTFAADEIVLSTHPPGQSNWLERGVRERIEERFDLPLTHIVVETPTRRVA